MIKKIIIISSSILLFTFSACNQKNNEVEKGLNEKLQFSLTEYRDTLKNMLIGNELFDGLNATSFLYYDTLKYFYSQRDFNPLFAKSFEQKDIIFSLFKILSNADKHGINPEHYHYNFLEELCFPSLNEILDIKDKYTRLAKAELLLSDAILKYSYHMRFGLVNPKEVFPDSYYLPVTEESKRDLFEPLNQENIVKYLQEIQPNSERYKKLQTALKHFKKYKNLDWTEVSIIKEKLEPGDSASSLISVFDRLITLDFLDTSQTKINDFTVYDSSLVNTIIEFQRTFGISDDGIIGSNTIEKLNLTPQDYINKIKINLERFRWIDYTDSSQYILVNIPDFRLFAYENGTEKFNMKVCVGQRRPSNFVERMKYYKRTGNWRNKPDDWETPAFYGEVSYLILNPTWNVPTSIIREEIFRKVSNDSTYLQTRNFKVYRDSVEINLNEVEVSELYSEEIPYRIVQNPGAANALGRIKFMFYNPFGIYLHDTPTRRPFSYSNRAVSHGCVRLEKPLQLAEYVLRDHSRWDIDYLKYEIGSKVEDRSKIAEYRRKRSSLRRRSKDDEKFTQVILDKKFPLFIDYYTAWVDDEGTVNFRDDVYRKDEVLMNQLLNEN